MVDIQTFRQRIGRAPGINARILDRKSRARKDDQHVYEDLLRKSLPRSSTVAGFLLVCAVLFLPVWLEENYLSCITSEEGEYHTYHTVTTTEVHQEWSIVGEVNECNLVNVTVMPVTVYETVFRNITKEKGSVTFVNMLLLMAGVESNPGPTRKEPRDLDILNLDDIKEDRGECHTTSFV